MASNSGPSGDDVVSENYMQNVTAEDDVAVNVPMDGPPAMDGDLVPGQHHGDHQEVVNEMVARLHREESEDSLESLWEDDDISLGALPSPFEVFLIIPITGFVIAGLIWSIPQLLELTYCVTSKLTSLL